MERRAAARVHDDGALGQPFFGRHPAQPVRLRLDRASRLACLYVCLYHRRGARPRVSLRFRRADPRYRDRLRAGWQWLYRELGHELPPDKWALMVGTVDGWDIWGHLEELVGEPLDRVELEREAVRARADAARSRGAPPGHRRLPGVRRGARAEARDRVERVAPVGRHAPRAARARRRLGCDRHRRPRPRARETAADALSRGARRARRVRRTRRWRSRTRRTARARRRRPASTSSGSRTRSPPTSASTRSADLVRRFARRPPPADLVARLA